MAIAFLGSLVAGGGAGAWLVGLATLLNTVVLILSFKYGTTDIKTIDTFFLCGALLAIIPWLILKDPLWSVVLAVLIDICGYFPTMRKTWLRPKSEKALPWALGGIKSITNIATLGTFNMTTVLFPAEIIFMNALLTGIILFRKDKKP